MSGVATASKFKENAHDALTDARLQGAMSFSRNFVGRRAAAAARLPEFEALRDSAKAIKDHALEGAGIEPIETDLGEYIIQLRGEGPSHIIAPAIHLTAKDIEQEFRKAHGDLLPERNLSEPEHLLAEARQVLRAKFLAADVGITGANFLCRNRNLDHR